MKVIYDNNIYNIEGDMNCLFFKNLIEEKIDEINLTLFEDIFIKIYNDDFDVTKEHDYENLYKGLTYFGSKKENDLILYLKNKIYEEEFNQMYERIKILFSDNGFKWNLNNNPAFLYSDTVCGTKNSDSINNFHKKIENPYSIELCDTNTDFQNKNIVIPVRLFERHIPNYKLIEKFNYLIPINFFRSGMRENKLSFVFNNPRFFVHKCRKDIKNRIVNIFFSFTLNWLYSNPTIPKKFILEIYTKNAWKYISVNPNVSINFIKKHANCKQNFRDMLNSDFNIRERCIRKIQLKKYFELESLNTLVKKF